LEARLRLTDTTNAFTYNLGVLVKPTQDIKVGLSYRARADLRFKDSDVKLGGVGFAASPTTHADVKPLPLPPVINAGLFWQISPQWGAEFVYEFTRWSEFKTFKANFAPVPLFFGAVPVPGFNLPQNWKDTSSYRFGSFYALNKNWELRGGVTWDGGPTINRTQNPSIPSSDALTLNAGIGYKWDRFGIDAAYMAVVYKTKRVSNNELEGTPATGVPFNGAPGKDRYENFNNFISLSASYRF
jgi:long-chain fatty acid transport protein